MFLKIKVLRNRSEKTGNTKQDEKYQEFMALVLAHQTKINSFIVYMVPQKQDSEDIFQDTLMEMWRKYDQFEDGSNFLAWSYTIAKYKVLNYRRKKKNNKMQFNDQLIQIIENESAHSINLIESRIGRLKECVRALSLKESKLIRLRYEDGLTFREIANIYGYSHQAICRAMGVIHSRLVDCINMQEGPSVSDHKDAIKFVSQAAFRLTEGSITEAEFAQLEKLLISDPAARKHYYELIYTGFALSNTDGILGMEDLLSFDMDLWEEMAEKERTAPTADISLHKPVPEFVPDFNMQKPQRPINKFSLYSAIASAAALIFVILYAQLAPVNTTQVIGELTRTVNAHWQNASGQIVQGCDLYPGPVKLLSGLAEVRFETGVKMIIEGPAEVEFESLEQVYLGSGNIVVNVSGTTESKKFTVCTDSCSVVDYGTEFGASVKSNGQVMVDVFEGLVSLRDSINPLSFDKSVLLEKGDRGQVARDGRLTKTEFKVSEFVRDDELDINALAQNNSYYRWKAYNYDLHRDPDLVAHFTFEKENAHPDRLINSALTTSSSFNGMLGGTTVSQGASVKSRSPEWIQGRWTNKTALAFKENSDSAVVVPATEQLQITGPITLSAWVKISGQNRGGALIDCRDEFKINYHMYLEKNGNGDVIEFRRYSGKTLQNQNWSVDCVIPKNKWSMVSATHDNKNICYYLNGELIGKVPHEYKSSEAVSGDLLIGRAVFPWSSTFKNDVGEIVILKRAMSSDEIKQMYLAGSSQ